MDSARSPFARVSAASSWLGIPMSDLATPFGPTPPTRANTEAAGWLGVVVGTRETETETETENAPIRNRPPRAARRPPPRAQPLPAPPRRWPARRLPRT